MSAKKTPKQPSSSRDKETDADHDVSRALAYLLRGTKGPETRNARLEDARVDYFRGKDLYKVLRQRPEIVDEFYGKLTGNATTQLANGTPPTEAELAKQITQIGQEMLKRGYFVKCDRVYKTPRPGRTKKVKFPKFLAKEPRTSQFFTEDGEGFYAWTYAAADVLDVRDHRGAGRVRRDFDVPVSAEPDLVQEMYPLRVPRDTRFVLRDRRHPGGRLRGCVDHGRQAVLGASQHNKRRDSNRRGVLADVAFDDLDANGNVVGRIPTAKRLAAASTAFAILAILYRVAPEKGSAIKSITRAHGSILDLFDLYDTPKGLGGSVENEMNVTENATGGVGDVGDVIVDDPTAGGEATGDGWPDDDSNVAPPAPPPPYSGLADDETASAETTDAATEGTTEETDAKTDETDAKTDETEAKTEETDAETKAEL
eukprot:CAMPEP_0117639870 /NCGR_PEP_ID=MMETSP0802-20121206/8557_1 /TAXON_ID=38833 /ORGANISM="Micromonas sp., Strain CCMP2099" /LENGTH=426 /DNA_ID=CAMNT_0005444831 /DNA_START=16 /DNA_END=1296 /DNA_ORIENTATION=+